MKPSGLPFFHCPVEQHLLSRQGNSLVCEAGHSFDLAREGYCNLLLVQQKASKHPGDDLEMVEARRRFLEAGFYEPLAEALFVFVRELAQGSAAFSVVDAGCGEGYYLRRLFAQAGQEPTSVPVMLAGFDISKPAVKLAAKQNKEISWAVASNRQLPFRNINLLLSFFGFPSWESFSSAQPAGGYVLMADAGADHLIQLREIIYPKVERSAGAPSLQDAQSAGYELLKTQTLRWQISLQNTAQIQDLLRMTPHYHRISSQGREKIAKTQNLTVTAEVLLRLLRKL